MDTILGILLGESYSGIRALVDLSMCVKYTNTQALDMPSGPKSCAHKGPICATFLDGLALMLGPQP